LADNEAEVLAFKHTRAGGERLRELVSGAPVSHLVGMESGLDEFEQAALKLQPEVLLVEFDSGIRGLVAMLERLHRALPRSVVIAYSESRDADMILAAMRAGAREYLVEPTSAQYFNEAVLRMRSQAQVSAHPSGNLLAVMGAKGGVGTSQLALNLAWALSQQESQRTALVDLDLFGGDLAFLVDLDPRRTIADVSQNFERLDNMMMDSLLAEVAPGLRLLAAPPDPVMAEDVRAEHVERGLGHLLDGHAMVVVDLPSRIDEPTLVALDRANLILLVLEPTLVGLKAARRTVELSRQLGHEAEKVQLVVNRFGSKSSLAKSDVTKVMSTDVLAWLPNDSRTLMPAGNSGRPALRDWPKSAWGKAVKKLAKQLVEILASHEEEAERAQEA